MEKQVLSPEAEVLPRYFINAWEKDPWKWQHHKYRRSRERNRGKWHLGSRSVPLRSCAMPVFRLTG